MKTQMHFSMHTESMGGEPGEAAGSEETTTEEEPSAEEIAKDEDLAETPGEEPDDEE